MNALRVIVWFVDEPGRAIEWLRWQVRLWIVEYRDRVKHREELLTYRYQLYGWPTRLVRNIVDRLSPFDPWRGYRRTWIRWAAWRLCHPRIWLRLTSLRWSLKLLTQVGPYIGPGRYDGNGPAGSLKAEWFDSHTEYAEDTAGNSDAGLWQAMFDLVPPWSPTVEVWLLSVDGQGFVYASQFGSWERAFAALQETAREYPPDDMEIEPVEVEDALIERLGFADA